MKWWLRLNILNNYVDYFVISESTKTHREKEKINFNLNNFSKFKDKIKFIIADYKEINFHNHIGGGSPIEQHQRNSLIEGIKAEPNDLIIYQTHEIQISQKLKKSIKIKFIAFCQKTFMYKLNLQNLEENNWMGSKITKMKHLSSMQELRNLKFKKYPFWN